MKEARILYKKPAQNGIGSHRMIVAGGRQGRGKEIYAIGYWPESSESCGQASQYCQKFAKKAGITHLHDVDSCGENYVIEL